MHTSSKVEWSCTVHCISRQKGLNDANVIRDISHTCTSPQMTTQLKITSVVCQDTSTGKIQTE